MSSLLALTVLELTESNSYAQLYLLYNFEAFFKYRLNKMDMLDRVRDPLVLSL